MVALIVFCWSPSWNPVCFGIPFYIIEFSFFHLPFPPGFSCTLLQKISGERSITNYICFLILCPRPTRQPILALHIYIYLYSMKYFATFSANRSISLCFSGQQETETERLGYADVVLVNISMSKVRTLTSSSCSNRLNIPFINTILPTYFKALYLLYNHFKATF